MVRASASVKFERRECSVYNGRDLIGRYLQTTPKQFVACDLDGRRLGEFRKERDVYRAVGTAFERSIFSTQQLPIAEDR